VTVRGIEQVQLSPADLARLAGTAMLEAADRRIKRAIGQTFPRERAADAHRAIEARDVIGETLLVI
jgi:NADPH:quinone reductase